MSKTPVPTPDGFYWEEWRNGERIQHGWHDGKTLSGEGAEEKFRSIRLTSDRTKSSGTTRLVTAAKRVAKRAHKRRAEGK